MQVVFRVVCVLCPLPTLLVDAPPCPPPASRHPMRGKSRRSPLPPPPPRRNGRRRRLRSGSGRTFSHGRRCISLIKHPHSVLCHNHYSRACMQARNSSSELCFAAQPLQQEPALGRNSSNFFKPQRTVHAKPCSQARGLVPVMSTNLTRPILNPCAMSGITRAPSSSNSSTPRKTSAPHVLHQAVKSRPDDAKHTRVMCVQVSIYTPAPPLPCASAHSATTLRPQQRTHL